MRESDRDSDRRSQSLECSYCLHIARYKKRPSTFPVPFAKKSEESPTDAIQRLNEAKCKVKFGLVETIQLHDVPLASQMTMKEKGALWWSGDDFKHFKISIKIMNRSMLCRPAGAGGESSYVSTLARVYTACMDAKTDDFEISIVDRDLLLKWARNAHCRRGLERSIIRSSKIMESSDARETIIHAVNCLNSNPTIDQDIKAESIRNLCTQLTRPSRLFAQFIALADAECIKPKEKEGKRLSHRTI
jgi:hypothetical protein